jgi:hypothetical protein
MIDLIPYFAGLITILFGLGFGYAITSHLKKDVSK